MNQKNNINNEGIQLVVVRKLIRYSTACDLKKINTNIQKKN